MLRGHDSNVRSPPYEGGEDDQLLYPAINKSAIGLFYLSLI